MVVDVRRLVAVGVLAVVAHLVERAVRRGKIVSSRGLEVAERIIGIAFVQTARFRTSINVQEKKTGLLGPLFGSQSTLDEFVAFP